MSDSFKISHFLILAGHFEKSFKAKVINMILTITRWILWKVRNLYKYERKTVNELGIFRMLFNELKVHIGSLQKNMKCKMFDDIIDHINSRFNCT